MNQKQAPISCQLPRTTGPGAVVGVAGEKSYSHHTDLDVGLAVTDRVTYYGLQWFRQVGIDSNATLQDFLDYVGCDCPTFRERPPPPPLPGGAAATCLHACALAGVGYPPNPNPNSCSAEV